MIGDKIILYRKRKGLTQEELADLLEVSRQTVTKWESGSVPVSYTHLDVYKRQLLLRHRLWLFGQFSRLLVKAGNGQLQRV